jgi:hypothetical protein
VQASVERVAGRIFPGLRRPRQHPWRRKILALVAGIAIFASGLGAGVAAYAATTTSTAAPHSPAFGIDCYADANAARPAVQVLMDDAALPSDPVRSCRIQQDVTSGSNLSDEAISHYLVTGKAECIIISSPGRSDLFAWKATQDPTTHAMVPFWRHGPASGEAVTHLGDSARPADFPTNCLPVTIPAPPVSTEALGACKIDARHAAVYPLDSATAGRVCADHGYPVWARQIASPAP